MNKEYKICTRCIMDTTDQEIEFDKNGVCNHCRKYDERASKELYYDEAGQEKLKQLIGEIKEEGKNKKYDCLIGVSGGTDSTFLLYMLKKLGLRPLAVHLDNGWNPELASKNIEMTLKKLNVDLHTFVLNWEEFKDLQLSFLKASIANAEIPTDHAILAVLYHTAAERGIKYIISGGNIVTEAIMPDSWMYDAKDWRIIKSIHKKFGKIKLKTFPVLTIFDWVFYTFVKKIKYIPLLNYIQYNKKEAVQIIEKELGWRNYGLKHYESIYTRFFQGYILPKKFNIDKRRAHLSTLICSGQIKRDMALEEMKNNPYLNEDILKEDKEYVLKKMGITNEEFEKIMSLPVKTYKDYPNNYFWFSKLRFFVNFAKKIITRN
jgi:N-acetyl sugar amidotransferase